MKSRSGRLRCPSSSLVVSSKSIVIPSLDYSFRVEVLFAVVDSELRVKVLFALVPFPIQVVDFRLVRLVPFLTVQS